MESHPAHNDGILLSRREHILLIVMKYFHTFIQAGIASCSQWWKTSIQERTHPTHRDEIFPYFHPGWNRIRLTMMEEFYPGGNTSYSQWWNISIISSRMETHPAHNDRRFLHLHLTYSSEGHALTSDLVGTESYTLVRMAPSPRLSYLVTDQVPPSSHRMAIALTSDLLVRMASTHIWPTRQNGMHSHLI